MANMAKGEFKEYCITCKGEYIGYLIIMEDGDIILSADGRAVFEAEHPYLFEDLSSREYANAYDEYLDGLEDAEFHFSDVKNLRRFWKLFEDGEDVEICEDEGWAPGVPVGVDIDELFEKYKTLKDMKKFMAYIDGVGDFEDFVNYYNEDEWVLYDGKSLAEVIEEEFGMKEGDENEDYTYDELYNELTGYDEGYYETALGVMAEKDSVEYYSNFKEIYSKC